MSVNMQTVLEQLFSQKSVTLPKTNRTIAIRKVSLRTMKPALSLIADVVQRMKFDGTGTPTINLTDVNFMMGILETHYDQVIELAASLSEATVDELMDMEIDESLLIIRAVVELNKDFFTKEVMKVFMQAVVTAQANEAAAAAQP